jgi:hypothetical protein
MPFHRCQRLSAKQHPVKARVGRIVVGERAYTLTPETGQSSRRLGAYQLEVIANVDMIKEILKEWCRVAFIRRWCNGADGDGGLASPSPQQVLLRLQDPGADGVSGELSADPIEAPY